MNIHFVRVNNDAIIPRISTTFSAGYDIFSVENVIIKPYAVTSIATGLKMQIPRTHFGKLESKSGLAALCNVHVVAGVIDSDYRGEIKVIICNNGCFDFKISTGMAIAQIIFVPFTSVLNFVESEKLEKTIRG
ncbi:dUTPase-like protein [Leptotrombidium deliense]|uniref:Deoxyuridine 5'-triphosphate nucleotidohydrolase n=1 Tax=Leptotrombidium deliense TaxID=299467 RepID=A0A443SH88_9ACAR|nr:dUTPase-like protein [Leptotrombidium deliense]